MCVCPDTTVYIRACSQVQTMHGTLHLVDLAGSERLAKSNATGDTHIYKIYASYICVLILEYLCPYPTIYMCAQVSG